MLNTFECSFIKLLKGVILWRNNTDCRKIELNNVSKFFVAVSFSILKVRDHKLSGHRLFAETIQEQRLFCNLLNGAIVSLVKAVLVMAAMNQGQF